MTKSKLIKTIHQNSEYRLADIEKLVNLVFSAVLEGLNEDGKVVISNFGTFEKVHQEAYIGVNPTTGEKMTVEATNKIRFTSSKNAKDIINL